MVIQPFRFVAKHVVTIRLVEHFVAAAFLAQMTNIGHPQRLV